MFRRGGKIILSLHPKPSGQQRGPFATSPFNYIRLVFRNGGEDEVNISLLLNNMHLSKFEPNHDILFFTVYL